MNPNDRLQARAFLADELYLRATRAEAEAAQLRKENEQLQKRLAEHEVRPSEEDASPGS